MASSFGFSRDIPLAGDTGYGQGQARPTAGAGPQEAVQVRSLRLPEYSSPSAIAPLPLLQSPGGAAGGFGGLDALIGALAQLFQGGGLGQQGVNPQMPFRPAPQAFGRQLGQSGPPPAPRIIPRDDADRPVPLPELPPIRSELPPPGKIDIGGNVPGVDNGVGRNPRGPDFFGGFQGRRGSLFPID